MTKLVKRREFCADVVTAALAVGCNPTLLVGDSIGDGERVHAKMPEINRTEIDQSLLDIDVKTRSNLFAWNGQFSPQFIETLLMHYATDGNYVADPFLGSGTVLYECARRGLSAYGIELNASAYLMAKVYEFVNVSNKDREKVVSRIDSLIVDSFKTDGEASLRQIVNVAKDDKDTRTRIVLSALVVLLDVYNNQISQELIEKKWNGLKGILLNLPQSVNEIKVEMGDARHMSLKDGCVDLIVTSPPYINVFNYHQKYRRSVELLGYDVLKIARSEFGSNRKNRSNRFLTVVQYCIDMAIALREAGRVCKQDARLIYVVGRESKVLGISFCNSELIFLIATEILGYKCLLRQERAFKNRYGKNIVEDILHFSRGVQVRNDIDAVEQEARQLAVDFLLAKVKATEKSDTVALLREAVEKASFVMKSEEDK